MSKKKVTFKHGGSSPDVVLNLDDKKKEPDHSETVTHTHDEMQELLQRQVDHEFGNERLYLSMAFWCEENGYVETAKFFSKHSKEERKHGMDFVNHMNNRKIPVMPPKEESRKRDFTCLCDVLESAIKQELKTTKFIKEIYENAAKTADLAIVIATKYLKEQLEEEQLFNSIMNLRKLAGDSIIDFEMEISKIKETGKYKIATL